MSKARNIIEDQIFKISVLALIPITGFWAIGLVLSIAMLLFSRNPDAYALIVFPSGFGLYALWWLIFKFQKIEFYQIPIVIKCGLSVGLCVEGWLLSGAKNSEYLMLYYSPLVVLFFTILPTFIARTKTL
jgi:hypothetical protein